MECATANGSKPRPTLTVPGERESRGADPLDDGLSAFVRVRPRLFGIAYRMLGNATEAEDIMQEVWLRWQKTDRRAIRDVAAFLATATTRLSINRLRAARRRREAYLGTWLPDAVDLHTGSERDETLEVALLLLLESLTPSERAAYVLREAFNYEYSQIAAVVRSNEVNCRQLVMRARKHIADGRRAPVALSEQRRLLDAFLCAAQQGDLTSLEQLFAGASLSRMRVRPARGRH